MAINIEWQVMPLVKGNEKEEKPKMFPRIIDSEAVCEQRLAELMAAHGSLSRGNAKAALTDLAEVMAELLGEGKTIEIPMLQWKPTTGVAIAPTVSQLIPQLNDYFQKHDSITRAEFEHMFRLKRTTAYKRLTEMIDKGVIEAVGNGRETKYVGKETL